MGKGGGARDQQYENLALKMVMIVSCNVPELCESQPQQTTAGSHLGFHNGDAPSIWYVVLRLNTVRSVTEPNPPRAPASVQMQDTFHSTSWAINWMETTDRCTHVHTSESQPPSEKGAIPHVARPTSAQQWRSRAPKGTKEDEEALDGCHCSRDSGTSSSSFRARHGSWWPTASFRPVRMRSFFLSFSQPVASGMWHGRLCGTNMMLDEPCCTP